MFSIGYGCIKRKEKIQSIAESDYTTAVILAAVHFEWMIKRTILKMGCSPTKQLRKDLEEIYTIRNTSHSKDYKTIWGKEVAPRFKNSSLGQVLGNLHVLQNKTFNVRGRIIHGNGTVSKKEGKPAIDELLKASEKLRQFTLKHGEDIDSRLRPRIKPRPSK